MKKTDISLTHIIGLSFVVIFFWIFAFNIWFSSTVLNQENFTNIAAKALTSEDSRDAIASEVVNVTQESLPIIGTITAPIIEKVVVGLLDTDLFNIIFKTLSEAIYLQLTTTNQRPLEVKIGEVISLIQPFLQNQDSELISSIPNKIVLIRENEIPNINQFANTLAVIGPISLIIGLVFVGIMWRLIINKRDYFIMLGLISAASGFLIFSLIPVAGNYLISGVSSPNGSIILTELYKGFTASLVNFSLVVLVIGLITAIVAKFVKDDSFSFSEKSSLKKK